MNALGAEEVYIHPFLTSALDGGELSASRPGFLTPEKRPWYAWDNNLLPLPEIEPLFLCILLATIPTKIREAKFRGWQNWTETQNYNWRGALQF
jgi:hypothetical protein